MPRFIKILSKQGVFSTEENCELYIYIYLKMRKYTAPYIKLVWQNL
jgi:hypothetical protein